MIKQISCIVSGNGGQLDVKKLPVNLETFNTDIKSALGLYGGKADLVLGNCNADTLCGVTDRKDFIGIDFQKLNEDKIGEIFPDNNTTVSVLLRSTDGKIVYYMANMNLEAYRNSCRDSQLWVYSKTNKQLQHKGATSGDYINLASETFKVGKTSDGEIILVVDVEPKKPSVCHVKNPDTGVGYPTCFFRTMDEFNGKLLAKLSKS